MNKEIQKKLDKNLEKIEGLNSAELLDYAKALNNNKDDLGSEVLNFLFDAVNERRKVINSNVSEKKECELQKMVKNFKKKDRK